MTTDKMLIETINNLNSNIEILNNHLENLTNKIPLLTTVVDANYGATKDLVDELKKRGKLQVQVSHPDKPVSACCN